MAREGLNARAVIEPFQRSGKSWGELWLSVRTKSCAWCSKYLEDTRISTKGARLRTRVLILACARDFGVESGESRLSTLYIQNHEK